MLRIAPALHLLNIAAIVLTADNANVKILELPKCEGRSYLQFNGNKLTCSTEKDLRSCSHLLSCLDSKSQPQKKELDMNAFATEFERMKKEIKFLSERLQVTEDKMCNGGQWGPWSQCSKSCGSGFRFRHRSQSLLHSSVDAVPFSCPPANESQPCHVAECINCASKNCKTYVRWGSDGCPNGRERLYTGIAAGSSDTQTGSGYNAICLSLRTQFENDHNDKDENGGRLYGAEYETNTGGVRIIKGVDGQISCSMCKVASSEVLMLPGTQHCPNHWNFEYKGYLMSNQDSRQKGEYVCVDQQAKRSFVGGVNRNQLRWRTVEISCGNLPCPPFVLDREVACVVCSLESAILGSSYIKWGSTTCSSASVPIYEGYAVGSSFASTGSGANPLCLNKNPEWGQHSDVKNSDAAVSGAIYGTSSMGIRSLYPLNNKLIVCTGCLAVNKSVTFTLPGSQFCPDSFKAEYVGMMFAAYYSGKKSNWVCVDSDAEGITTAGSRKQAVWFPTEVECTGMECNYGKGDYVQNRELACTVCSSELPKTSSTFIAWGQKSCGFGDAQAVYEGFMAGSHRSQTGNGANLLCMPARANYGEHSDSNQDGARLSGYEYKSGPKLNYEIPCVLCETNRPDTFTNFGQLSCPHGYEVAYSGKMFSTLYSEQKGEFVCVNKSALPYTLGNTANNAGTLYYVEAECGSLPCPPFTQDREVVCVQCVTESIYTDCPYFHHNGYCIISCPFRTYADKKKVCQPCNSECKSGCSGAGSNLCFDCRNYVIKQEGDFYFKCVPSCPDGMKRLTTKECVSNRENVDCFGVRGGLAKWDKCGVCRENSNGGTSCDQKSVYIRWGQKVCPPESHLLYDGITAGSSSSHSGSGFNLLCLPSSLNATDTFLTQHNDDNHNGGLLYGIQYTTSSSGVRNLQAVNGRAMPCAVCESKRSVSFVISATRHCPNGWLTEYSGYLMSTYYTQTKGEFVCVDGGPVPAESPSGTHGSYYSTEFECGNLPCPRSFVQDREATCAVCSALELVGSIYVRWGRKSCGNVTGVVTLYDGIAAASHSGHIGSGANALCLSKNVSYGEYSDSNNNGALLYGLQYESLLGVRTHNRVHQHLAPCSVCFTENKLSNVLIVGTNMCPSRWSKLYSGYLYGGYHSQYKTNYECVDSEPESLAFPRGNSARWYPTQVYCGSISCSATPGGYVQHREVTCAVCQPDTDRRSVVFTRWGRTVCPTDARKVYGGFVAGSNYGSSGNGANLLCINESAYYGEHQDGNQEGSRLFGYEYSTSGYGLRGHFQLLNDYEVPCVVCESLSAESGFWLYGSKSCPEDYSTDYEGYVFAHFYTSSYTKGQYVCVDREAEAYPNGRGNSDDDQGEMFPVETECDSLPCPPYTQNREAVCAHCSKRSACQLKWKEECVLECPKRTFRRDDQCLSCHPQCTDTSSCKGPTASDCMACSKYVFNDTCVAFCPEGTIPMKQSKVCIAKSDCIDPSSIDDCGVCNGDGSSCNTKSVYTRWGSLTCPSSSKLLYTGVAAGAHNWHSGSGFNRLCLPFDPVFDGGHNDGNSDGALVFGAVYNTSSSFLKEFSDLHGFQVSCAVCEAPVAPILIIPGMTMCPQNFKLEYKGYMMANHHEQFRSEYVCVDMHPTGGSLSGSRGEAQFHFTEFNCGSLPCDKYPSNREVTCSVCASNGSAGSTFVHWGRNGCSGDSMPLYTGFAASSDHSQNGGGANPLCLPEEPVYDIQVSNADEGGARLYGATYATAGYGLKSRFPGLDSSLIPCAVCFISKMHNVIAVPGRLTCPERFLTLYRGYLFGARYNQRKINWICVDENAESSGVRIGAKSQMYPTEIECGSIHCNHSKGGYVQNREVTCVLCTADSSRLSTVYTRWGRADCPEQASVIYSGQAAGSHYYNQWGSGANVLCLHQEAQFGQYDGANQEGARLYGYEYSSSGLMAKSFANTLNREIPCAVCETVSSWGGFTFFGSRSCPGGYRLEYAGYVYSHYYQTNKYHKGEFICIDQFPSEFGKRGSSDDNQGVMYSAEVESCNYLPCPPYRSNREIDCAFCGFLANDEFKAVDCIFGQWGSWGSCSEPCNVGEQIRVRSVVKSQIHGGRACPHLKERRICNTQACAEATLQNGTYIRWGQKNCSFPSRLVMTGIVAGAHYGHSGAGYNYLCLPDNPVGYNEDPYHSDISQSGALLYGTEIKTSHLPSLRASTNRKLSCARCATQRGVTVKVYGTAKCPESFVREYYGYIMAPFYHGGHYKGEYICVDAHATGTGSGSSQSQLYSTELQCGGLPCPPFTAHREMACAVCSSFLKTGSFYSNWGDSNCPSQAATVYSGIAAGAHYTHTGGGANVLCMIGGENQTYLDHSDSQEKGAYIYGFTYVTSGYGLQTLKSFQDRRVPCSVCFVENQTSTLMIPARKRCPADWDLQYAGYLFAGHYSHQKSDWLCVNPDSNPGSSFDTDQAVLYPTEIECGSIACGRNSPYYAQNREVTCVVCASQLGRKSTIYTRWGRLSCPSTRWSNGTITYSGFAAGSHHSQTGSGSSVLCLHSEPDYSDYNGLNQDGARIYGYEYETSGSGLTSPAYQAVHNQEIPCVVCDLQKDASVFVHFGESRCPRGYQAEYTGYAFSHLHSQKSKGEHICIDSQPESYPNGRGSTDDNQGRLFPVETECGTLPCPPYTGDREVKCAVCSWIGDKDKPSVDCQVTNWSPWTPCSASCGEGVKTRERKVSVYNENGGHPCPQRMAQTLSCFQEDCKGDKARVIESKSFSDDANLFSIYVRWGAKECPGNRKTLLTGFASSSKQTSKGSGYNRLCLTSVPSVDKVHYDKDHSNGILTGAEYETGSDGLRELRIVNNKPIPCSLCEVPRSAVRLFPGTIACPKGWHTEYTGYIFSNYYSRYRGEYTCVDKRAQPGNGTSGQNSNGWYPVEIECGSSGCPLHAHDRELSCAVCSLPEGLQGSVYTRWGRQSCPQHSQLVYLGRAFGPHHDSTGSGANPLCLVSSLSYGDHDGKNQDAGRIYGIRYATSSRGLPTLRPLNGKAVPCAVCFVLNVTSTRVIPAATKCPSFWRKLYSGYIFAAYYSHKKLNWMCVDGKPEATTGSSSSPSLIYPTEVECGSIVCQRRRGGYVQNKELACVACTTDNSRKSAVYIAWGRRSCPMNPRTRTVYSGFAAGSHHSQTGGGAEMLCLPALAAYGEYESNNQDGARIYGYEYYTSGYGLLSREYKAVHHHEVACSACEVVGTSAAMVVYGTTSCPDGYVRDYSGYIFATADSEEKGQYVCVHSKPEGYKNGLGATQNSQAKFFPVEAECTTLPCPPYTANREILCAQCTKAILIQECPLFTDDGTCLKSCPEGKYSNQGRICLPCHEQCAKGCTGPSAFDCEGKCKNFQMGSGCVKRCPERMIKNGTHCVNITDGTDCHGVVDGSAKLDQCGVCGGNGDSCNQRAVYVRWGRTYCPETARLLFHGITAGSLYSGLGNGFNYLCLPLSPSSDWRQSDGSEGGGRLYGTQYLTGGAGVNEMKAVSGTVVPCAVCEAKVATTVIIPGSNMCPRNWTTEYEGYLMAASTLNKHYKTEHICVDRHPESAEYNSASSQSFLTFVEGSCGALKCPPYVSHRELTCAVCASPPTNQGTAFVRWGATSCPEGTTGVYTGQAASSHLSGTGGGANPLCVSLDPIFLDHNDKDGSRAKLRGLRYRVSGSVIPTYKSVFNRQIPCTLCFVEGKGSTVMVAGQNICPHRWSLQYSGYLLATYYTSKKSNWICGESNPDGFETTSSSQSDYYTTETECGSLSCLFKRKGYFQNRELTCSICTPDDNRQSVVYTRWGQIKCPSGSNLVYQGMVAGSKFDETGSGANYVCLRNESAFDLYNGLNQDGARLYGCEYETVIGNPGMAGNFSSLHNHEMPCVVCEELQSVASFTLFGSSSCPDGYDSSFKGFAFSSYYSSQKGQYICVDEDPTAYPNSRSSSDDNQCRLYPVEFQCGTLPCPPFTNDREVPCAQCSRHKEECLLYSLGEECISSCPINYFPNEKDKTCLKCHKECDGCFGGKDSDCLSCKNYLGPDLRCVPLCPEGFFKSSNGSCLQIKGGIDCEGVLGGKKKVDRCGVCGGDGNSCNLKAVYVRWGRSDCPDRATLVLSGHAAGSHDAHTGGGYNPICLKRIPSSDWIESDADEGNTYLYGFSYGSSGLGVQELSGVHGSSIPCAVCEARTGQILTTYGTYVCPLLFSLEYAGYLLSNRNDHKKGEYLCVDQKAVADREAGGSSGSLWTPTEYKCGSLPCPPYTQDREVTCGVCSPSSFNVSGAIFVRWGRTSCEKTTTLYSGRTAGPYYSSSGSGSNLLCLVENPRYFHHNDGAQKGAFLYGVQYGTSGYGVRSLNHLHYHAAPCAVCLSIGKSTAIMVAGRTDCPSNFFTEYYGYLFGSFYSHSKSNWVCLDKDAEKKQYYSSAHSVLYPTEIICGSLKCGTLLEGGYVQYDEVTCAVCSPATKRKSIVYPRYGRPDCPETSQLVYSGFVAGSAASRTGGGASVLCMRKGATYLDHNGKNQGGAYLEGFEYETSASGLQSGAYRGVNNREIPCALCENPNSESTFTQFGSNQCPDSYQLEYSGFLFSAKYTTSRSLGTNYKAEFVCIDFSPQPYENGQGSTDNNQGRFFAEQIYCSGLPCPPFTNYREVTCAQCSKASLFCGGYRFGGNCVEECPKGTYADFKHICRSCHPLCDPSYECSGNKSSDCDKCLHVLVSYHNAMFCSSSCPYGFVETIDHVCYPPPVDCEGKKLGKKRVDACGVCGGNGESCDQGAVYTRWGRTTCPETSKLLFSGFAASSNDGHTGSGFNRICLSPLAGFAYEHYDGSQDGALMYGAEYETASSGVSSLHGVANSPIPCALCEAPRGPVVVVTGSTVCPDDWVREFFGYIMSNYYTYQKGEYVCVDASPESGQGASNQNSNRWYTVEMSDCGNVFCPPYINNRELTCAVCIPPSGKSGASYTRWGRSVCPTGVNELYKGQAVGSHYSHSGGGVNSLCLTRLPSWDGATYSDGVQHGGKIFSISYQPNGMITSFSHLGSKASPCVVCFTEDKSNALVVSGSSQCPEKWMLEYSGYVLAAYHTHHKTDWVCVDQNPETFSSKSGSSYWYPAEIRCGSLRCRDGPDQYVNYREVTCAVCSPDTQRRSKIYTRWGGLECAGNDTAVYKGFTAGAHYSHKGSGSSLLCMTENAKYLDRSGVAENGALLYGVEYETSGYIRGNTLTSLHNREVACTVCENFEAIATLTVYGDLQCPKDFSQLYNGYVFANYYKGGHYRTSYVCVDRFAQPYNNGRAGSDDNNGRIFPVETECGTLPCPPYTQDREIVCVTCARKRVSCPYKVYEGTCVKRCPSNSYLSHNNFCLPCHVECSDTCKGSETSDCERCLHFKFNTSCVRKCPEGTKPNPKNSCEEYEDSNVDCSGTGGSLSYDVCGVCNGDNSSCDPASVYVRWGREDCPPLARLLYKGIAAGSHHGHQGSGYNFVCLPSSPSVEVPWEHRDSNEDGGLLYGIEYETSGYGVSALYGVSSYQMPCSVCESNSSTVVVIPGTSQCPENAGFTEEYTGYLVSNYYHSGYYRSEYVCTDSNSVARKGSPSNSNQGRVYPTETECGSLPCPPYTHNREVNCVVCSLMNTSIVSTFARWGRRSCPKSTTIVYDGVSAANYYSYTGAGANMQCLSNDPKFNGFKDGNQNGALLYGVTFTSNQLSRYNSLSGHRLPCSICQTDRSFTLTIPGRLDCPANWIQHYAGYLMAAYSTHQKINWVCVDEDSESGGKTSSSSVWIYPTEIECGSIRCRNQEDRYVQNREVTCSVCSPPRRHSVAFTRWGRTSCPEGASLVYSGFAAGSIYSLTGSGANVLCMRREPTYGDFNEGDNNGALLYGYEYETTNFRSKEFKNVQNHEVACAVCEVTDATETFTSWGEIQCPQHYSVIYEGFVFSHHYTHKSKGEFICIDRQPEGYDNTLGSTNHDQSLLYPVELECGSLPCPPYHQNREVVCSQCVRF